MKSVLVVLLALSVIIVSCGKEDKTATTSEKTANEKLGGQSSVIDDVSEKNVVKVAVGSKDHTTLVAAIQAAELVDALSNAGPFTVFAPTNAAFDKLPKGTVDDLLKPENKGKLTSILQHHVLVAVYNTDMLTDGRVLSMVDGTNAKITKKDGATYIDKGKISASVKVSNGIVHIIDEVILPPSK